MGSWTLFIAGPNDQIELSIYIESLGLFLVSLRADQEYTEDANAMGGCWISPVPAHELRPWGRKGEPKVEYSDVIDPLIGLIRSNYMPPYITPGNIHWNNDVPELARLTKSNFQKISRWIRRNWPKPEGDDWHFGPEAKDLVFNKGIKATSMVPGVTMHWVPVYADPASDDQTGGL